jgi:hypothetical protein
VVPVYNPLLFKLTYAFCHMVSTSHSIPFRHKLLRCQCWGCGGFRMRKDRVDVLRRKLRFIEAGMPTEAHEVLISAGVASVC